jgi:hypothetical protein
MIGKFFRKPEAAESDPVPPGQYLISNPVASELYQIR